MLKDLVRMASLLTLVAGTTVIAAADTAPVGPVTTWVSEDPNPTSGLRGIHINRSSSEQTPHGISLDLDDKPVWDMGIDFQMPDLILAYSHITQSDQFRMRPDTGQLELGPRVGHPVTGSQVNVTAGTSAQPLDGIGVGINGNQAGLYIYQTNPSSQRAKVNFTDVFQMGTDSSMSNARDFWLFNNVTGRFPVLVTAGDQVEIGYGATIGGSLQHTGSTAGFYGATPIAKPTITGSRKDGTAWANLLAKLVQMGLVNDGTTP
jgi:hypothetical protein